MTQKPKLAICVGALALGAGQTTVVLQEAQHLQTQFSVTIVTEHYDDSCNVSVAVVNTDAVGWWQTIRVLWRSDVIHCHDSLRLMAIALLLPVPTLVTSHGVAPTTLRTGLRQKVNGGITQVLYPFLYRRAAKVVAISPYIMQWLGTRRVRNTVMIENGTDPKGAYCPTWQPDIVYVGEVSRRKGIDDLLAIADLLPPSFTLWIVGAGGNAHQRRTSAASVGARVVFTGVIPQDQLDRVVQTAVCTISASHWEGFGLPIVEGFGWGRPCIVRRATNLEMLVEESGAGYSFSTLEEVPELLSKVIANWPELSRNARAYAKAHSWEESCIRYQRLIAALVGA